MLNKEIFISIVVPVYNTEQYLDECLQSILKQTIIGKYRINLCKRW